MKAATRTKYGNAEEVLSVREVDIPSIKDDEVLIKVYATTVNRTDCVILLGKPVVMQLFTGFFTPKSPTPGTDFAGVIEAMGKNVTSHQLGDKVWGLEDTGISTQAQYVALSDKKVIMPISTKITFEQAAASAEGAHYAYNFINKVKLKAGQNVMINGATGAIGSALVQFCKHFGLQVTATCKTESIELVKSIGADSVIDYTQEDFTQDKELYHYVFDSVGKSSFGKCKRLLLPKGIYISSELGDWSQNPFLALITPLFGGKKVIFPIPLDIKKSLSFVNELIEKDEFRAMIDKIYPLEKIQEAYTYASSGHKKGNLVIRMWEKDK